MTCLLCRSSHASEKAYFFQSYPQGNDTPLRNAYYYCSDCGCFYVWPLPTDEQINKHWQSVTYADLNKNSIIQLQKNQMEKTLLRKLLTLTGGRRLLDYGCGFGNFMSHAREVGFDVEGLDANHHAVEVVTTNGLRARQAWTIRDASFPGSGFDVVVAIDSFYYTWDPHDFLREVHRVLSPSGILAMRISNKTLFIKTILKTIPPGLRQEALLARGSMNQFHCVPLKALKYILSDVGLAVFLLEGAPIGPVLGLTWSGLISYSIARVLDLLTMGNILIHPGIMLLARKV
jgi:SAM-dependent methyltransferase